jgi:striatin 1/3/4
MTPGEAAEKIPPHLSAYSSLKREYGKKETNPFSAAAGIEVALKRREPALSVDTTEDTDVWDFDSSDTDSASSDTRAEEPIEYGSLEHAARSNAVNSHRRKLSLSSKRRQSHSGTSPTSTRSDSGNFKVKFALRGHLDVVRAVVFTGGGTASEPEICTAGDDGVLKRWTIPGNYGLSMSGVLDVDVTSHFTHRGHAGMVTSLAAYPGNTNDGGGGGGGGGWVFSGGQDFTIKIWEAGKVDPVETLVGHTDAVWAVCVLPSASAILGSSDERIFLASGSADGTVKIWSVTAPASSPRPSSSASNSSVGSARSFSAGYTNNVTTTFEYSLVSTISGPGDNASPTSITPMNVTGETFIVSYDDASVIIYDTASCEEVVAMASQETYDGTPATGVSSVVATTMSLESGAETGKEGDVLVAGATGQRGGVGGVLITGHEDRYVRIFDANSGESPPPHTKSLVTKFGTGQCTYTMLAHPAAISSLALSPDGRELVSAGHDASLRFWSMEKRACTQEITCHRLMRGEGVCAVVWSVDGKWVVSGGGDGVVKVYCR